MRRLEGWQLRPAFGISQYSHRRADRNLIRLAGTTASFNGPDINQLIAGDDIEVVIKVQGRVAMRDDAFDQTVQGQTGGRVRQRYLAEFVTEDAVD